MSHFLQLILILATFPLIMLKILLPLEPFATPNMTLVPAHLLAQWEYGCKRRSMFAKSHQSISHQVFCQRKRNAHLILLRHPLHSLLSTRAWTPGPVAAPIADNGKLRNTFTTCCRLREVEEEVFISDAPSMMDACIQGWGIMLMSCLFLHSGG